MEFTGTIQLIVPYPGRQPRFNLKYNYYQNIIPMNWTVRHNPPGINGTFLNQLLELRETDWHQVPNLYSTEDVYTFLGKLKLNPDSPPLSFIFGTKSVQWTRDPLRGSRVLIPDHEHTFIDDTYNGELSAQTQIYDKIRAATYPTLSDGMHDAPSLDPALRSQHSTAQQRREAERWAAGQVKLLSTEHPEPEPIYTYEGTSIWVKSSFDEKMKKKMVVATKVLWALGDEPAATHALGWLTQGVKFNIICRKRYEDKDMINISWRYEIPGRDTAMGRRLTARQRRLLQDDQKGWVNLRHLIRNTHPVFPTLETIPELGATPEQTSAVREAYLRDNPPRRYTGPRRDDQASENPSRSRSGGGKKSKRRKSRKRSSKRKKSKRKKSKRRSSKRRKYTKKNRR